MSLISMTLSMIISLVVLTYLAVRGGEKYGHQDAHVHSEEYAGIIREGHGPLTVFLIVAFLAIFLWTAVYFVQHAGEFGPGGGDRTAGQNTVKSDRPSGS